MSWNNLNILWESKCPVTPPNGTVKLIISATQLTPAGWCGDYTCRYRYVVTALGCVMTAFLHEMDSFTLFWVKPVQLCLWYSFIKGALWGEKKFCVLITTAFNVTDWFVLLGDILFYVDELRHGPNEPSSVLKIANRGIIKDYSVDLLKCCLPTPYSKSPAYWLVKFLKCLS